MFDYRSKFSICASKRFNGLNGFLIYLLHCVMMEASSMSVTLHMHATVGRVGGWGGVRMIRTTTFISTSVAAVKASAAIIIPAAIFRRGLQDTQSPRS